ncbi:hypothetical protein DFJ74DRAFT_765709 [Hyaloraphidium curvatum]|nr:hypothetical protein DFJ74DRAFT_765709 [Hyaloraphidium curvatum]
MAARLERLHPAARTAVVAAISLFAVLSVSALLGTPDAAPPAAPPDAPALFDAAAEAHAAVAAFLAGCQSVYWDFGSNIGVQLRKLFEAEQYGGAAILPTFDRWFGNVTERRLPGAVCAVGVEPNPLHLPRLRAVEACHGKMGWKTLVLARALSNRDGPGLLFAISVNNTREAKHNFWGAMVVSDASEVPGARLEAVDGIDAAKLIHAGAARRLPDPPVETGRPPFMGAKVDVEGAEYSVVSALLFRGALQHLREANIEWHPIPERFKGPYGRLRYAVDNLLRDSDNSTVVEMRGGPTTKAVDADDESFLHDGRPWPCRCLDIIPEGLKRGSNCTEIGEGGRLEMRSAPAPALAPP